MGKVTEKIVMTSLSIQYKLFDVHYTAYFTSASGKIVNVLT